MIDECMTWICPEDYGAVGNGVTDDGPAIQAAINDSAAQNRPIIFDARTYATAQELMIPYPHHAYLRGTPYVNGMRTVIKAIAPMRAVLSAPITCRFEDFALDGNRRALVGLYGPTFSLSQLRGIGAQNCLRDGVCFPGEDDNMHHVSDDLSLEMVRFLRADACWVPESKRNPLPTKCTVMNGSPVVTFSGAIDLTTLGIDTNINAQANIVIKAGNTIFRSRVVSVDGPTQLTMSTAPGFNAMECSFAIANFKHSINDTNSFFDFATGGNGELWCSPGASAEHQVPDHMKTVMPTVRASVSGRVISFEGPIDLYAMKLRRGDAIRVGVGEQKRCSIIISVDSPTQLTCANTINYSGADLEWAIGSGEGYHEAQSSDNNFNSFQGSSLHRHNASAAFGFNGLYGPILIGAQIDYQGFYGIRVGNDSTIVIGPTFIRNYCEASGSGKMFYVAGTKGMTVIAPTDNYGPALGNIDYSGDQHGNGMTGVYIGRDAIDPIGSGLPMNLVVNKSQNLSNNGMIQLGSAALLANSPTPGYGYKVDGENDLWQSFHPLFPGGQDTLLTGKPTFTVAGHAGQWSIFTVDNNQTGGVILQDDRFLDGTKLRLSSNRVRLQRGEALLLFCDGLFWYEISRLGGGSLHGLTTQPMPAGSVVARIHDTTPTPGLQPRTICMASAKVNGPGGFPVGIVPGLVHFGGTDVTAQATGEVHIPDHRWPAAGFPMPEDAGKPVYLSDVPGMMQLFPGTRVVRLGTVQTGGSGMVMIDLNIEQAC